MPVDLSSLNEEQLLPVRHTEGAVLVTAGAGSGKTRLLTHRIAYLIEDLSVKPYNILAITFTNKAAEEMQVRLARMIPSANDIWVMTFHALCVRILRKSIDKLGYTSNFTIYTQSDSDRLMTRLAADINKDEDFAKKAVGIINDAKNKGVDAQQFRTHIAPRIKNGGDIAEVYAKYNDELKKNNALDFDGLLTRAHELLDQFPEVAEYYQQKFRYIHVDEFQDTNAIQYKIVKILGEKHKNILAVGDEDQSIYGWRGARISNIFDFKKEFNCTVFKLEQNYRSTKKILEIANRIIANNTERMPKTLWTENRDGVRIENYTAESENAEADYVVSTIMALKEYSGYKNSDFAILMRVNALSRAFEERLTYYNMQYKLFGGQKFYERKEIKDLTAYLKILANPQDTESLLRIINFPKRNIGDSTVEQLLRYCDVENKQLMQVILDIGVNDELPAGIVKKVRPFAEVAAELYAAKDKLKLAELVKFVLSRIKIMEAFADDTDENYNRRLNIEEFYMSVESFEKANENCTLEDYLMSVSLYADTDDMDFDKDYSTIATIHSAKGLEFKVVFVVGLEDGLFPVLRSLDNPQDLEEERRLMYVAVTRAKERLYLTSCRSRFMYGQRKQTMQSRFLREAFPKPKEDIQPERTQERSYYRAKNDDEDFGFSASDKIRTQTYTSAATVAKKVDAPASYPVGTKVRHRKFGVGTVIEEEGSGNMRSIKVNFDGNTIKLIVAFAPLEEVK